MLFGICNSPAACENAVGYQNKDIDSKTANADRCAGKCDCGQNRF